MSSGRIISGQSPVDCAVIQCDVAQIDIRRVTGRNLRSDTGTDERQIHIREVRCVSVEEGAAALDKDQALGGTGGAANPE